ncbi:MAG: response regulator transcription factor [Treponema sp.]|nr:response regulator transcription factor [Treponema sp.]
MPKILLVEDDKELSKIMQLELKHEGFEVYPVYDGRQALDEIAAKQQTEPYDLMLLDVMLPKVSGLEVLRKLRAQAETANQKSVPIILVTARGETIDKVDGLNSGADDYITKPFKIEELLARINAVLRRTQAVVTKSVELKNGTIVMTIDEMKVLKTDKKKATPPEQIELSKNEFFLLKLFLENQEKILSRDQIIQLVWGEDYYIEENSVDVYVRHLRKKFGEDIIKTVRGMGYIMKTQTE